MKVRQKIKELEANKYAQFFKNKDYEYGILAKDAFLSGFTRAIEMVLDNLEKEEYDRTEYINLYDVIDKTANKLVVVEIKK